MQTQMGFDFRSYATAPIAKPSGNQEQQKPKQPLPINTIKEVLDAYKIQLKIKHSKHTVANYPNDIMLFDRFLFEPGVPDKPVALIFPQDLTNFINHLIDKGEANKSIHRRASSLKHFFGWLYKVGAIENDPSITIDIKRTSPPLNEKDLTEEDCALLIQTASTNARDYVLINLLYKGGLKRREIKEIKIEWFDLRDKFNPTVHIISEKTYQDRVIYLPVGFAAAFEQYTAKYGIEKGLLFPITERALDLILESISYRALGERVNFQIVRDAFGVRCIMAGDSPEELLRHLGLSNVRQNNEIVTKYHRLAERQGYKLLPGQRLQK